MRITITTTHADGVNAAPAIARRLIDALEALDANGVLASGESIDLFIDTANFVPQEAVEIAARLGQQHFSILDARTAELQDRQDQVVIVRYVARFVPDQPPF